MLFLHVLLFSLVGTSVFALNNNNIEEQLREFGGFNAYRATGYESDDDLNVRISTNGLFDGFWSRVRRNRRIIIQVHNGRVHLCRNRGVMEPPDCMGYALGTRGEFEVLTRGAPWYKFLWDEDRNRMIVSGLL
jgi:hypothetical protein